MNALRRLVLSSLILVLGACAAPIAFVEGPVALVPPPALQNGDTWVYAQINAYNGLTERILTDTLVAAKEGFVIERRSDRPGEAMQTEIIPAPWRHLSETIGSARRTLNAPLSRIPFPVSPGQSWREQATVTDQQGVNFLWRTSGRAVGWERVRTAAGEYVALRVERSMNLGDYDYGWSDTEVFETYWYAPEVKRWVRMEHQYVRVELMVAPYKRRSLTDRIVWELREFRPGR